MTNYERLSGVLDRQQKYRVLDTLVALVLVLGLAVAAFAVVLQMPGAPAVETLDAPAAVETTTSYTARLLLQGAELP